MNDNQEAHEHADEVGDLAEWIIQNLDKEGVSPGMAAHALGFALALVVAGQPMNQAELMDGVIGAIRNTFNDAMAAQVEVMGEREAIGATLQ